MCSFRLKAGLRTLSLGRISVTFWMENRLHSQFLMSEWSIRVLDWRFVKRPKPLALDSGSFTVGSVSVI